MRPLPLVAASIGLVGCMSTITNQAFYEDEAFLTPLPSAALLSPPAAIAEVPQEGSALVIDHAVVSARELSSMLGAVIESGEVLRDTPPHERTDRLRRWTGVNVSATLTDADGSKRVAYWWIDAEVARSGSLLQWTMWGAADSSMAEAVTLGFGTWENAENWHVEWNLGATSTLVDTGWFGVLNIDLQPDEAWGRDTTIALDGTGWPPRYWRLLGPHGFAFTDLFGDLLPELEEPVLGVALTVHDPAVGGRAEGWLYLSGEPIEEKDAIDFLECWDLAGDQQSVAVLEDLDAPDPDAGCGVTNQLVP